MAQHFDIAVIGMRRTGVLAAALLAKRGRRVLLVDHGEGTATYPRKGLQLPLVPTVVPAFLDTPHVQKVVAELGLGPELRATTATLAPALQVVLPEHRIDVHPDRNATLQEIGLEFSDQVDASRAFFERLDGVDTELGQLLEQFPPLTPHNLVNRLVTRPRFNRLAPFDTPVGNHGLLTNIAEEHILRQLQTSLLWFLSNLVASDPGLFHGTRALSRCLKGVLSFENRIGGLSSLLLKTAESTGVEVRRGAVVRQLQLKGRRIAGLEIESERRTHTADYYVANTLSPFQGVLPPGRTQNQFAVEQQLLQPVATLLTINLVVDRRVIPKGMGEVVLLLDGRRSPRDGVPEDPPILLRRYPAVRGEPSPTQSLDAMAVEGQEVLCAACPAPIDDVKHSPERFAALKDLLHRRLKRLVPFLDDYVIDTSYPVETSSWDVDHKMGRRRIDPLRAHPLFELQRPTPGGVGGRPIRTCVRNLVRSGPDVVPGLGLEGEFLAAWETARALGGMAGGRWKQPLKQ